MDYKTIGKRIMLARKESGMLQRQLGDKVRLDQTTISCYEKGILAIEMEMITKLAQALGKPVSYFYGEEYSSSPSVVSLDEISIPIFTEIPRNFPDYSSVDVKGHQKHPRHMYTGADFILKKPVNLAQEPDDIGDYYYFRVEREPQNGKAMLFRMDSKFFLQRVTLKRNALEVHSIKHDQHLVKPQNVDFLAVLLQIANDAK